MDHAFRLNQALAVQGTVVPAAERRTAEADMGDRNVRPGELDGFHASCLELGRPVVHLASSE